MKSINVQFEDEEWQPLSKIRFLSGLTWREFIIAGAGAYEQQKRLEDDRN